MYDLLIKGGRVIDPTQNIDDEMDIAINGEKIAAVARDISLTESQQVVDARGKVVTPGLIDLHCHVYDGVVRICVDPDVAGVRQGVTTVVDGGSAGQAIFGGLPKYVIPSARTTIFCFLHLCSYGESVLPEFRHPGDIDPAAMAAIIEGNRDIIRGVKLRLVGSFVADTGIKVVAMAKNVAKKFGLPIMVHIGDIEKKVSQALTAEILPLMDSGDILCHIFTAMSGGILRPDGFVLPEVKEAMARGVVLDAAHGRINFSFDVARKCLEQGIFPTVLSSDLSASSLNGPVYGLTATMSKLMALGLDLKQIVTMTTINPARVLSIGDRKGSLKPGMDADVSILELLSGTWELIDSEQQALKVSNLIAPSMVVKSGQLISAQPVDQPRRIG